MWICLNPVPCCYFVAIAGGLSGLVNMESSMIIGITGNVYGTSPTPDLRGFLYDLQTFQTLQKANGRN